MTPVSKCPHRLVPVVTLLAIVAAAAPAMALPSETFSKHEHYYVRDGEVVVGDKYMFAQSITVSGTHEGDLIGFTPAAVISGVVTGDVMLMGQSMDISGHVQDTVRVWTQGLTITGTVDGDVVFFGSNVTIHPNAHIKGKLIGVGGTAIVDGIVERGVELMVGQANLNGEIRGDAVIKADAIALADTVSIAGDLRYTARKELELDNTDAVAGEIIFTVKEKKQQGKKDEPFMTTSKVLWFAWRSIGSMLVGFVLLALGGKTVSRLVEPISTEPMMGTLIGFGSFLVVPAACFLAIVLIISMPLGLLALIIFAVTLYVAKLPVALWLGDWILSRLGMRNVSPFLALALGVILLYLVFAIPFYVGFVSRLAITWLGLGTIILAVRGRTTSEPDTPAAAMEQA